MKLRAAVALAVGVAALVVAVLVLAGGNATQDAPPPNFTGVVAEDVIAGDGEYRRVTLRQHVGTGIGLIRQTFDWAQIESRPGRYDFALYDAWVSEVAKAGIQVLPILFHPPAFRSGAPRRGPHRGTYPPARSEDMAEFAGAAVRRYGRGGSFWRDNPKVPAMPIRAWQVWNEPNLPAYWPDGPDPAGYARLLEAVGGAIRAADPEADVVSAGLAESRSGMPLPEFVAAMYRTGGRGLFDVFALHPFAASPTATVTAVERARRLLDRYEPGMPIWVTEFGWASQGPESPFTVGPTRQAQYISETIDALSRRRAELGLRGLVYFNWRDAPPYAGGTDFWGLHTGLLSEDGTPKPSLQAFRDAARPG